MVKVTGAWVPESRQGKVMGFLSLSYLIGDVFVRNVLGLFVKEGMSWRNVVLTSAAINAAIVIPVMFVVRDTPKSRNLAAVVLQSQGEGRRVPFLESLKRLFRIYPFLLVCVISFMLTLIRETFNVYSVAYLESTGGGDNSAFASSLFPLFGIPSVLIAGYLIDHLPIRSKGFVVVVPCALLGIPLCVLGFVSISFEVAIGMLACTGLFIFGPYSLLAGKYALEFGGLEMSGTASAITDASGYIGAVIVMMISSLDIGYSTMFQLLFFIALGTCGTSILFSLQFVRWKNAVTK